MNPELKRLLIEHGVMKSKQHSYAIIKNLVEELYMEDTSKCEEEVCAVTTAVREELSEQDIQELSEVAEDLCFYIAQARELGLSNELLNKVRHYFNHVYYSLEFQGDIAPIAMVMGRFTTLIYEYKDSLNDLSENQIDLVAGFVNDFRRWVALTYKDGKSTDGLDASILSGFEQIQAMVKPYEEAEEIELW